MLKSFCRRLRSALTSRPQRSSMRRRRAAAQPMEALEDRVCLAANLNLLSSGLMIYGASGVDNNLTINFDGTNYTFQDTAEAINAVGGLAGLDTNPDPNIVTFDPTAIGGAFTQVVMGGTGVGNDTLTINGWRGGNEGLDVRSSAAFDQVNINTDLGTAANRISASTVVINADAISLGGGIFTSNRNISLGASGGNTPVTVTAASEVDAGTATVEVNAGTGQVTGTGNLTIDGGSVQLRGNVNLTGASNISLNSTGTLQVGTTTSTTSLTSGTGAISLAGTSNVILTDTVTTAGTVSVTSPATSLSNNAGTIQGSSISVSGTLTNDTGNTTRLNATAGTIHVVGNISNSVAATNIDIDATGNADFDATVSAEGQITVDAGSINAVSFQTSGGTRDITITGPVTFDGVGNVLVTASGAITFADNITGNGSNLQFITPDIIALNGDISNVATLTVQSTGGSVAMSGATATDIVVSGTDVTLAGDLAATAGTGGSVSLTGPVTLIGAARSITSGGDASESILVSGTIDGLAADTTALTLSAGNAGDVTLSSAVGGTGRLASLSLRGDSVTTQAVNVQTDLTVNGGNIRLQGAVTGAGTGTLTLAPAVAGRTLDLFNNPANTRVGNNTRITSDTTANVAANAFAAFRFGDADTGIVRIHPDADNSLTTGTLKLNKPTTFEAGAIILSEDLDSDANSVTFVTDNLAMYRGIRDTGNVTINKKTAGGTLELRGRIGSDARWGTLTITINAAGATVNAPAAGAALPVLGLGTNQPAVNLGGATVHLIVNADTLNALAPSAVVSAGNLQLNVDTLNITGGVQTVGAGTVTLGNPGAAVNNIGGGPTLLKLPAGSDLSLANYDGNGGLLTIVGAGGQLGTVTLSNVSDTGTLTVGTSAANDATTLNVNGSVTASSVTLRADALNLNGTVSASAGTVSLVAPVTLTGNSALNSTGGQVFVQGTVNGAFGLSINTGTSPVSLTQAVGGTTALDNLTIVSGGQNFLTVPITVTNAFSWTVGTDNNGVNDRIIRAGAGSVTSTNGPISLTADVLQGITGGVHIIGPNQTLTERGAGN